MVMVMHDYKRNYRAEFEQANRIQDYAVLFCVLVLLVMGMGACWSIGDELRECRLAAEAVPKAPVLR